MDHTIQVLDHLFEPYISASDIQQKVNDLGKAIHSKYKGKNPIFIIVLNGAYIFAADLVRACGIECEMAFVKLSSYSGLASTGTVTTSLPLPENLKDRHLILVEDIVDTGNTLSRFIPEVQAKDPASIAVASLLVKPTVLQGKVKVDFAGFEIPPEFVVGYGLDYEEHGRHLPGIYKIVK